MQFERFYSLKQSIVTWFAPLHQEGFQPTFPNLEKCLWWEWCECEEIYPSTTLEGSQTPHLYICHGHGMQVKRFYSLNKSIVAWFAHMHQEDFSQLSQIWACVCGGNDVNVKSYGHWHPEKVHIPPMYVWHWHGMQFERFCSLNPSVVAWFTHLHQVGFQPTFTKLVWVWSHMPIHNLRRYSKHHMNVWHRCWMQFERYYSLKQSVVAWFAHLHQVGSQPTFTNLGKCLLR